ncbi:MAG: peptidylprolyl isomerase [Candidatus Woesearchaeota archaeon]
MVVEKIKIKDSEDFDLNENIYKTEFEDDFDEEKTMKSETSKKKFDIDEELKKDEEFEGEDIEDDEFPEKDNNTKKEKKDEVKKKRPITIKPVHRLKPKKIIKIKRKKSEEPEKTEKRKKKSSEYNWIWILLIIISLVVIVFLVFKMKPDMFSKKTAVNETENTELAAVVNGEPIYLADINERYNLLSPVMQQMYSKEFILNQTIDETLLIQEAKKKNILVTEDDIDKEIQIVMDQNGLDKASLEENLKLQGITMQYLRDAYRKKLTVDQLVKQITFDVEVTAQDITDYYNNNSEIFKEPEKVAARHILISTTNRSDDDAKKLANTIKSEIKSDNSNFCDLVVKYSEDPGSRDICGTYTFPRGQMVQEFEDAAFNGKINNTVVVKTQFGYHVMQTLRIIPARIVSLEEVYPQINKSVRFQKETYIFQKYMSGLREKAEIVNYLENPDAPRIKITQKQELENVESKNVITPAQDTQTKKTKNTEIEPINVEQETVTSSAASNELINCLNNKGAVVYGASWKKEVRDQLALFGDKRNMINFVECDKNIPKNNFQKCQEKAILTYPTWIIGENKYSGYKSAEELSVLADC